MTFHVAKDFGRLVDETKRFRGASCSDGRKGGTFWFLCAETMRVRDPISFYGGNDRNHEHLW
jgi:hypothetical protein